MQRNQKSTASSDEQRTHSPALRLISSPNLTPSMAVNYLFKWRGEKKLVEPLLRRIYEVCLKKDLHYIPTIIFIMSVQNSDIFENFCEDVASISLAHYLLLRWSYSTYLVSDYRISQVMINRLDTCLLTRYTNTKISETQCTSQLNAKNIHQQILNKCRHKEILSNYAMYVNDFFERLFKVPQKLKSYAKPKRNARLRYELQRALNKFKKANNEYKDGIYLPVGKSSNLIVNIATDYCFTFSTKERVPFKLVLETATIESKSSEISSSIKTIHENEQQVQSEDKYLLLPSTYFGKRWSEEVEQIRANSSFKHLPNYSVQSYIVKSGDDLRQEHMAMQLINLIQSIAQKENIKIWVRPYAVVPFNKDSGLIQFINDTKTVSYLKEISQQKSLRKIYCQIFGSNLEQSILNFTESLAGYSLIQYLFEIKDRHNNNIMIDGAGHMVHIDFSFMLSSSPGNINFQRAPFKLTPDYVQLMEGVDSDIFKHFKMLFLLGLKFISKYKREIVQTITMMTHCSNIKCMQTFDQGQLQKKFMENATDQELEVAVERIISFALRSFSTGHYDTYQWYTNEIYA